MMNPMIGEKISAIRKKPMPLLPFRSAYTKTPTQAAIQPTKYKINIVLPSIFDSFLSGFGSYILARPLLDSLADIDRKSLAVEPKQIDEALRDAIGVLRA